jgi:PAS domain S-box-containing protein
MGGSELAGPTESPELWRALVEAVPDPLLLVREDGIIQYLNRSARRVASGPVQGTRVFDYVPAALHAELRQSLAEIFSGGDTRIREIQVTHLDGSVRWYATHPVPVLRDGVPVAATIVARDVTGRKQAEAALRESEERNRTLVEHAPEAIVVFDVDAFRFLDVNSNACALFGLSREKLLASNPIALSPPTQAGGEPSELAALRRVAEALGGGTPVFDWTHLTPEGVEIRCEVRLVRLPSERRRLVRASVTDVTRQRRLEEHLWQLQRLEAVGHLAGGVAHDFNNLLTVILGSVQVLREELPPGDPLLLETEWIERAAARGSALTRQLLDFARQKGTTVARVDLNRIAEDSLVLLERLMGSRVRLVKRLDPTGAPVTADGSQLEQVLMNLVLNARDAMPQGGTITVSTSRISHLQWPAESPLHGLDRVVRLRVEDTGAGMDEATQQQIFQPFFTTKAPGSGTGLGLAIVEAVVKRSGGCVGVTSRPEGGSTFDVYLPETDG